MKQTVALPTSYKLICMKIKKKRNFSMKSIKLLPSVVSTCKLLEELLKNVNSKDMSVHNNVAVNSEGRLLTVYLDGKRIVSKAFQQVTEEV
jgi:hypothetical protein